MDIRSMVPLLVQISLALILGSFGLRTRWRDLVDVLGRPLLVLRGFVAINVVVPAVAIGCMLILPVEPIYKVGIVAMAIAPLSPFVPGKMLSAGAESGYAAGLYVVLLLLSILIVPATLMLVRALSGGAAMVPIEAISERVFVSGLLPLIAGIVLGALLPARAPRLAAAANLVGILILFPLLGLIVVRFGSDLLALAGNGVLAAMVLITVAGIAAGHWLGGPLPSNRRALALAAATRHPGIAGLIIHTNFNDRRPMLAVLLFLLIGMLVSAIYLKLVGNRSASENTDAATPGDRNVREPVVAKTLH